MKKTVLALLLIITLSSCKSSKRVKSKPATSSKIITKKDKKVTKTHSIENKKWNRNYSKADYIIDYAQQFKGVRYKWGGTTKSGMDCSGLIYEAFKSNDIFLPRISRDMAKKGNKIQLKKVLKGDLLFFKTGNRRNAINHVGLIVDIRDNDIKFIHATTSKGVIVSGLNETYWLKAFHEARRIL